MFEAKNIKVETDENKIGEVLTRGVENIYPSKELLKTRLLKGEKLTLYYGIDPTGPTLHLGHLVQLKKLSELQKLGHQIILLIGDFTAMIGDPTDKMSARVALSHEKVLENAKLYQKQASQFISFTGENRALLRYNSEWLKKMNMEEMVKLLSNVTYSQIIKRDMFQERISQGKDLFLHEIIYPIMQGFDSIAMDVDGEVGGNDQTFNMLVGRDLIKKIKNKEKFVIATKLLVDSAGKKMGKTENNMVSFDQTSEDMFGKVMSWSDNLIIPSFEILTGIPMFEIKQMEDEMSRGSNPKDYKMRLAKEIVSMIHGEEAGEKAQESFEKTFKKGEVPEEVMEIMAQKGALIRDLLVQSKVVSSNGDWSRLVKENAVSVAGTEEIISDPFVKAEKEMVFRIGKKRFVKIIVK